MLRPVSPCPARCHPGISGPVGPGHQSRGRSRSGRGRRRATPAALTPRSRRSLEHHPTPFCSRTRGPPSDTRRRCRLPNDINRRRPATRQPPVHGHPRAVGSGGGCRFGDGGCPRRSPKMYCSKGFPCGSLLCAAVPLGLHAAFALGFIGGGGGSRCRYRPAPTANTTTAAAAASKVAKLSLRNCDV